MQTLNNLLTKWKLWINRDHTFQADELKELQSHLMEEINYLVNREGLSEEEAFHKAVGLVGEREGLDQEYVKTKSAPNKVIHWVKVNPLSIITSALVLVFVIGFFLGWYPVKQENAKLNNQLGYTKTYQGTFKAFEVTKSHKPSSINKPKIAWKFDFDKIYAIESDEAGNVYYIDSKNYRTSNTLYCLTPTGEVKWLKENIDGDELSVISEGVIVKAWKKDKTKLFFYNRDGQPIWEIEGNNPTIGQDGMFYAFKQVGKTFFSFDVNGKTRWEFKYPDDMEQEVCFFDTDTNVYVMLKNRYNFLYLYKFSSKGELLLEKELPISKNDLIDLDRSLKMTLNGKVLINQFILFHYRYNEEGRDRVITAFDLNGIEKWGFIEPEGKLFNTSYVETTNGSIILTYFKSNPEKLNISFLFNSKTKKLNFDATTMLLWFKSDDEKMYLQYVSDTGKLIWERKIINTKSSDRGIYTSNPVIDKNNQIYITTSSAPVVKNKMFCFDSKGTFKWSFDLPNPQEKYYVIGSYPYLKLSNDGSLFYSDFNESSLFSIQDEKPLS